jgi:hypothetical protein
MRLLNPLLGALAATSLLADALPSGAPQVAVPAAWEYTAPLLSPERRATDASCAQKDPSIVYHGGRWHIFMTVKLPGATATEYASFEKWEEADRAPRALLKLGDSSYCCAPQTFFFAPHKKWYLVYQMGVPGSKKLWVAYSTTETLADPASWTRARPILDGGPGDGRVRGGLDFWIICDDVRAYLFFTSNDGKLWRMWTRLKDFPGGFAHCEIALQGAFFEASHTYKVKGANQYLTLIEENGRRYYKAYVAERLDGAWTPLADSADRPFAGWSNIRPAAGVAAWTDNVSHGELVREGADQTMTVDAGNLRFVFQGLLEREKAGRGYGQFPWRIGLLTPALTPASARRPQP